MSVNPDDDWTSIPVRPSTRDKVHSVKREGETWTETLDRLIEVHTDQGGR